jgi:HD superfamily phosphodiesterase
MEKRFESKSNVLIDTEFHLEKIAPTVRDIFSSALPFLETRKNKIHTFIVYQYARALLNREGGAMEIVLPACILHDVGWSAVPEKDQLKAFGPVIEDNGLRRKHEIKGVAIAKKILLALNYDQNLIYRILNIIDGHDTTPQAKSLEDAIVKDADKLWRYSEIGLLIDIQRFKSQLSPYLKYLRTAVDKWFLTEEGKKIAIHELQLREKETLSKKLLSS